MRRSLEMDVVGAGGAAGRSVETGQSGFISGCRAVQQAAALLMP